MIRIGHGRSEYTCPQCHTLELRQGRFVAVPEESRSFRGEEKRLPEICRTCLVEMVWTPQSRVMITRDEIPGGITLENYGSEPVTFYSHSERHRYMDEHGLTQKETFAPFPGTDTDPAGVMNPKGYVDEQTLRNGAELMLRAAGVKTEEWDPVKAGVLANVKTIAGTERDAQAVGEGDKGRMSRLWRRLNG